MLCVDFVKYLIGVFWEHKILANFTQKIQLRRLNLLTVPSCKHL